MELMILSFKTQINGKPTNFSEKIWQGLIHTGISDIAARYVWLKGTPYPKDDDRFKIGRKFKPKIHTIREDKNNRWESGIMIDFFINARQKDMFRFAPRIPVVSTQEIFMTRRGSLLEISIAKVGDYIGGDDYMLDDFQKGILCQNDGFDEWDDFRDYFIDKIEENGKATGNYWFKGKIIHWTDLKY